MGGNTVLACYSVSLGVDPCKIYSETHLIMEEREWSSPSHLSPLKMMSLLISQRLSSELKLVTCLLLGSPPALSFSASLLWCFLRSLRVCF